MSRAPVMQRFITLVDADLRLLVFAEHEDWADAQNDAEEWVWQTAETKEQALSQHYAKHDEWALSQTELQP